MSFTLKESNFAANPKQYHLSDNYGARAAILGVPGISTGQLKCHEVFGEPCPDPVVKLGFMQILAFNDARVSTTSKKRQSEVQTVPRILALQMPEATTDASSVIRF